MAIAEVTIVPLGTATTSLSRYVADCHKVLMAAGDLKYELNPMGTVIEGDSVCRGCGTGIHVDSN